VHFKFLFCGEPLYVEFEFSTTTKNIKPPRRLALWFRRLLRLILYCSFWL